MSKLFKYFSIPIIILAIGAFFSFSLAQELPNTDVKEIITSQEPAPLEELKISEPEAIEVKPAEEITEMIEKDEDIKPKDLEIKDQKILPDSPLYLVKRIVRGVQSLITFDPVKKAELKLKFADEKIIEAKKLAEKTDNQDVLKNALENYQKELDGIKDQVEKIKQKAEENPKIDRFVDKFIDHNTKQQKLIDKLEEKMPEKVFDKIQEVKKEVSQKFADVTLKVSEPEKIKDKIVKILDEQPGSDFKHFKNLEVLKRIEEKVPEEAKEAIRHAQENAFKRLQEQLERDKQGRPLFKEYIKNIAGNEARHLEIVHDFENRMMPSEIRDIMEEVKQETVKRIEKRIVGFKDEKHKEMLIKHLEEGKMEDLRILKELENNLPPAVIEKLSEIKNKAMENFQEKIASADTPEKQEALLKKIEKFHDVKEIAILKEIDNIIPEDKKEFWEEMKVKIKTKMEEEFSQAASPKERQMFIEKIAGDDPEHIKIIKEFGPPPHILNEILKEQTARLTKRIQITGEAEKLQILKEKIEEESIKKELQIHQPAIFREINKKEEIFMGRMSQDKAKEQLEKAKAELAKAEQELTTAAAQQEFLKRIPAQAVFEAAKRSLEQAQTAFENGNYGQTFGNATAALHQSNSLRQIIKETNLREKIIKKREIKKRRKIEAIPQVPQFKDELPKEEREQLERLEQKGQVISKTPSHCICITLYDPVCGKDGKTYSNECVAKCNGVEIDYKGVCKGQPTTKELPSTPNVPTSPLKEKPFFKAIKEKPQAEPIKKPIRREETSSKEAEQTKKAPPPLSP